MKEEDFIRKNYGSGNPFKVPDSYFQRFTADLMNKLPETETQNKVIEIYPTTKHHSRIAYWGAAAAICAAIILGTYLPKTLHSAPNNTYYADDATAESIYIDDALDYAMVTNHEIAQYLSEAY